MRISQKKLLKPWLASYRCTQSRTCQQTSQLIDREEETERKRRKGNREKGREEREKDAQQRAHRGHKTHTKTVLWCEGPGRIASRTGEHKRHKKKETNTHTRAQHTDTENSSHSQAFQSKKTPRPSSINSHHAAHATRDQSKVIPKHSKR